MTLVAVHLPLACRAEGLAGTRTCPAGFIVGPTREAQREGPAEYAAKEMTLGESDEVVWSDFGDGAAVDFSIRNESCSDEFSCPGAGFWIVVIVVVQCEAGLMLSFSKSR